MPEVVPSVFQSSRPDEDDSALNIIKSSFNLVRFVGLPLPLGSVFYTTEADVPLVL